MIGIVGVHDTYSSEGNVDKPSRTNRLPRPWSHRLVFLLRRRCALLSAPVLYQIACAPGWFELAGNKFKLYSPASSTKLKRVLAEIRPLKRR
jgi:hypothetical protein